MKKDHAKAAADKAAAGTAASNEAAKEAVRAHIASLSASNHEAIEAKRKAEAVAHRLDLARQAQSSKDQARGYTGPMGETKAPPAPPRPVPSMELPGPKAAREASAKASHVHEKATTASSGMLETEERAADGPSSMLPPMPPSLLAHSSPLPPPPLEVELPELSYPPPMEPPTAQDYHQQEAGGGDYDSVDILEEA